MLLGFALFSSNETDLGVALILLTFGALASVIVGVVSAAIYAFKCPHEKRFKRSINVTLVSFLIGCIAAILFHAAGGPLSLTFVPISICLFTGAAAACVVGLAGVIFIKLTSRQTSRS